MNFSVNGDNSEKAMMMQEMIDSEIDRMLSSVNNKIMRITNMFTTKLYMLQSTEMVTNKIQMFCHMVEVKKLDFETSQEALRGEFYRQAIIIFMINIGRVVDAEKMTRIDMMIIEKIEMYLAEQQMDLTIALRNLQG